MRDCVRFAPMIGARPGELSPDEARALESHLAACPACRGFAADVAATEGLVARALLARAGARDFSPFVDQVMAKVGARPPARRGLFAWLGLHRRAAVAALAPVLAALALIVYVRMHSGGSSEIAMLEISAEGEVTTILETADGPIVLLAEENGS